MAARSGNVLAAPMLGAIAVTIHKGRVLLVQRGKMPDAGLWGFPGGHVELGETALEAAVRELREETGVIAEPLRYLTNIDVIQGQPGAVRVHYLLAAVLCRYVSGDPVAADDAMDARWLEFAEIDAATLPMSARVAEVLRLARMSDADPVSAQARETPPRR